jgi:hypothetical protein
MEKIKTQVKCLNCGALIEFDLHLLKKENDKLYIICDKPILSRKTGIIEKCNTKNYIY